MSPFKTFVVAGAIGGDSRIAASLGGFIVKALLNAGASVKVLARASSAEKPAAKALVAAGATIAIVDYDDAASLETAVTGVDVVISGLAGAGLPTSQPALADASKKVGVKLFVPSEYGANTLNSTSDSPSYSKRQFHDKLKAIGLPYLLIFNGVLADWVSLVFVAVKDGEVTVVGDGKKDISLTARADIASFIAHVLTTLPPSELSNKVFSIEGTRTNTLALIEAKSAKLGSPLKIKHITRESALEEVKAGNFLTYIKVQVDAGNGTVTASTTEVANGIFPAWNPTPIENFLA